MHTSFFFLNIQLVRSVYTMTWCQGINYTDKQMIINGSYQITVRRSAERGRQLEKRFSGDLRIHKSWWQADWMLVCNYGKERLIKAKRLYTFRPGGGPFIVHVWPRSVLTEKEIRILWTLKLCQYEPPARSDKNTILCRLIHPWPMVKIWKQSDKK